MSEKIESRSGREREKENGTKNEKNGASEMGNRDAAKKTSVQMDAFKRKLLRTGLRMEAGPKEENFSKRMWSWGPRMGRALSLNLSALLPALRHFQKQNLPGRE